MIYFIVVKHQLIEGHSWIDFLTNYELYLEKFTYAWAKSMKLTDQGFNSIDLEYITGPVKNKDKPFFFDTKEEAKEIAKLAKLHTVSINTDLFKPSMKKSTFYLFSTNNDQEEIL